MYGCTVMRGFEEIARDVDAFREKWGMGFPEWWDEVPEEDKRRMTARDYALDILGIDENG